MSYFAVPPLRRPPFPRGKTSSAPPPPPVVRIVREVRGSRRGLPIRRAPAWPEHLSPGRSARRPSWS